MVISALLDCEFVSFAFTSRRSKAKRLDTLVIALCTTSKDSLDRVHEAVSNRKTAYNASKYRVAALGQKQPLKTG